MSNDGSDVSEELDVAIIGMAGRFPGANDVDQFWNNVVDGVESIRSFSDAELLAAHVSADTLRRPNYVKASAVLDDIESFDAGFFNFSALEAKITDPQRRIFLECCWHALEDAAQVPDRFSGPIGVYAGVGLNMYLLRNLIGDTDLIRSIGLEQLLIASDKDFLPTQASYKLNLSGPSLNVNTACSTSLVAVHLARQALLLDECDMALAGGASVNVPQLAGYEYVSDGIQDPTGHCRAFDARARGTVWGSGCGVVVLKRLSRARADHDRIRAVIKGSAINNDGAAKVGYTAPSVQGQASVVTQALAAAGVSAASIGYVEAHATGTQMGDPIEVAALTRAFREDTERTQFCALGSVKANIGHLNAAAGVASLIKTVRALETQRIPGTFGFEAANPKIDFANSPFYVEARTRPWQRGDGPRRAGVSSLGIGGTNAHVVLEEAALKPHGRAEVGAEEHQLVLSAKTPAALDRATLALATHLETHPELSLEDVAFTLKCGRKAFSLRRAVRCRSLTEAIAALREGRFEVPSSNRATTPRRLDRWLNGEDVDFAEEFAGRKLVRVGLPLYPFERERFWVEAREPAPREELAEAAIWQKKADMADWFARLEWKRSALPLTSTAQTGSYLVFSDGSALVEELIERLRERGSVCVVSPGHEFQRRAEREYSLPFANRAALAELWTDISARGDAPSTILYFWSLIRDELPRDVAEFDAFAQRQQPGFFTLLDLAHALADLNVTRPLRLVAFTSEVYNVTGQEQLCFAEAAVSGICRVLQQEYNNIVCRSVDVLPPRGDGWQARQFLDALVAEVCSSSDEVLCAYRGLHRWVPYFDSLRVQEEPSFSELVTPGDVYVAFYALEGIGFLVARQLLEHGARLIFLEDSRFPVESEWQALRDSGARDVTITRIDHALALRASGYEFAIESVDFDDREALESKLRACEQRFGAIRGLIHAAGASNFERVRPIRETNAESSREHFSAISYSFIRLEQLFRDRPLKFRILMSSLGSVLGGLGFSTIAAACGIAGAYAALCNARDDEKWTIQYWDGWDIEWNKTKGLVPDVMYQRVAPSVLDEREGLACFRRSFAVPNGTALLVCATDLESRYRKWVRLEPIRNAAEGGVKERNQFVPRPELSTPFVEPNDEVERVIAGVYREMLGVDRVGVNDGFHELGGHSLLAVQMIARLREVLRVDVELFVLMAHSTVGALAKYVSSQREGALA